MFENISNYIIFQSQVRPNALFAKEGVREINFQDAVAEVSRISFKLNESGFVVGDRVGILGKNSIELILLILACSSLGIVSVPMNYRLTRGELSYIVENSECKGLFFDSDFEDLLNPVRGELGAKVCFDNGSATTLGLSDWLAGAEYKQGASRELNDKVFDQLYTSGTTGRPKGTLLSHSGFIANCLQTNLAHGCATQANSRLLMVAPNFHAVGLSSALWSLMFGAGLIIQKDFDSSVVATTIANEKITNLAVVPVMLKLILSLPSITDYDFSSLSLILYGGSPLAPTLLKQSMEIFKCKFAQGYGQTEATTTLTILSPEAHMLAADGAEHLLQSGGKAVVSTKMKIIDEQGVECAVGVAGEIVAAGPQIMKGYWRNEDATQGTLVDGWLKTGDVGEVDVDGYLYIKDRLKDMIISGGENIYSAEVESVLLSHPEVFDCAVVGVSDEKWGEVPVAFMVAKPGINLADLEDFARKNIAGYKVPKQYYILEQLPRNSSGKILKKDLRDMLSREL